VEYFIKKIQQNKRGHSLLKDDQIYGLLGSRIF